MAQFTVRRIEDEVRDRLKALARANGRSMEEEVRAILRNAARHGGGPPARLGTRMAARFASVGLRGEIAELRGATIKPVRF